MSNITTTTKELALAITSEINHIVRHNGFDDVGYFNLQFGSTGTSKEAYLHDDVRQGISRVYKRADIDVLVITEDEETPGILISKGGVDRVGERVIAEIIKLKESLDTVDKLLVAIRKEFERQLPEYIQDNTQYVG